MPEDPKDVFRRIRAKQDADAEATHQAQEKARREKERARRERRRREQPPQEEDETEAALWVRETFDWQPYPELWVPHFCSWSDYVGTYVERSNGKALIRDFPNIFEEGHGGYNTVWVGMTEETRKALSDEDWSNLQDVANNLENYPVYDEDLMSEMEMETQWEDWEEYGRSSTREALIKKFEGDVNAQIAVLAKRNEFWDTVFREHDFYEDMSVEDGGTWYFNAEAAVKEIEREEIVNEAQVEAAKKETFTRDYEQQLWQDLDAAGVTIANGHHLWEMVKYAESVIGPDGVWEVNGRIKSTKDEIDAQDYILMNVADTAKALTEPEAHQKMMRKHWAQDPRQLKLPGYESLANQLVAVLLEAEDPKSVWRAMQKKQREAREVHVVGRRWFRRTYGVTYFTADIYVNDTLVHTMNAFRDEPGPAQEYGYGDPYLWRAFEWLEQNNYIPQRRRDSHGGMEAPWRWAEICGFKLTTNVYDVRRERDL